MQPQNTDQKPGYEQRDIDVPAILRPAVGLLLVTVFTFVAMHWTIRLFEWRDRAAEADLATRWTPDPPPEPHLQTKPPADLARMRAEENAALHRYEWVDRRAGVARIPVERAIEILAERGLPARPEASP